jgi:glycosyltransferase involved in cell wall biosynthesis
MMPKGSAPDQAESRPVWVVIPAHDEAASIGRIVAGARLHAARVWVVADGCTDATAAVARKAGADVLRLPRRSGKAAALREAWRELSGLPDWESVVLMDGDGQHDPEQIPRLMEAHAAGADLVMGRRDLRDARMPRARRWTNRFMTAVINLLGGCEARDSQCGFRLVSRRFLESRDWRAGHFEIESEMVLHAAWHGWPMAEVPVPVIYRGERSKIVPVRDALRWFRFVARHAVRERVLAPARA